YFLHDGRARNLMEAVLWHGGEAETAKQNVLALNKKERDALIAFLNSL
ncbi:di-heme oxidoredictase family protein, partial [Vibrio sp. Vb2362]|nr:di-heme oxidoredictase family protein [Vibrio sp. Vb2362]